MPHHHPSDEMLLGYASGSLQEPLALLVATHMALCPDCRQRVSAYEELGGDEIEAQPPATLESESLMKVLERLDQPVCEVPEPQGLIAEVGDPQLPRPLRDYVGGSLEELKWRRIGGFAEASLLPENPGFRIRLTRARENTVVPEHSHLGLECTLVLAGGFSDSLGHYVRGDIALADPSVQHRPVADPGEDCICLVVTDAPLRFTGLIARLLSPLLQR